MVFKRYLYLIVPIVMLAVVVAIRVQSPPFVEGLQLQVFDLYQRLKPRTYTPLPVKIIDIDDESVKRIGQWPWPRTYFAELISDVFSKGAMVLGFDVVFSEPDRTSPANVLPVWAGNRDALTPAESMTSLPGWAQAREAFGLKDRLDELPDHDAIFADAIREAAYVVTGYILTQEETDRLPTPKWEMETSGDDPRPYLPNFRGAVVNLPEIDEASAGNGVFNLAPDRDNIIRRIHLLFRQGDIIYPTLAAETIRVFQGASNYTIETTESDSDREGVQTVTIGGVEVPTDTQGRVWIHFTKFEPSRYIPAWKLLDGSLDSTGIEGHILFLGASAAGLKDTRATPLNPVTPGVEVYANVIEQVLLGEFLQRPEWVEDLEIAYLIVLSLTLIFLLRKLGAMWCTLLGFGVGAIALGYSWYAYVEHRWLIDPVVPSLAVLLIYLTSALVDFAQAERQRRQVRNAFNHYLAPAVIEQLVADPKRLTLSGEKRETTFLFTDIAGFTSLAEGMAPTKLVEVLNGYLDETCNIVMRHGGTIDKIVGDALHVIFNAPTEQPDHAERAVKCAVELDEFCESFSARKKAEGMQFGQTRIGVNTGTTVVGNFGGSARFDYTAHGDAINTAARLESVNKHLGTRVCVSGTSAEHCHDIRFRPIGRLVLKGKTEGIETFEPLPDGQAESIECKEYLRAFDLLEKGDPSAGEIFSDLARRFPNDVLIAFHAKRLAAGESGVRIVMQEK